MTTPRVRSARLGRAIATVAIVGLVITALAYVIVRNEVDRLSAERVDAPARAVLLNVDHVTAAVDQVLATANGAVLATGADPEVFLATFGPDVLANPALSGMALIVDDPAGPRVAARIGDTPLLDAAAAPALATSNTTTLVAHDRAGDGYRLAFADRAVAGAPSVYLEITMPATGMNDTAFALVAGDEEGRPEILLGNVESTDGLTLLPDEVALGGHGVELYVAVDGVEPGWFGLSLPVLVLIVGLLMTAAAAAVVASVTRRKLAVETLGAENRALDRALQRQREIEAQLRSSQDRFRTILRDTPDAIALLDLDQRSCEILNRPDFFGHPLEALAYADGLAGLVHPDDCADADAHWARLREMEAEQVCETTMRFVAADGNDRYVRLRSSPLCDSTDGEASIQLALLSDVTDEWLNQLREAELETALRISQRREAIGELAGGVAHDFNNILAVILACAEMLIEDLDAPDLEYAAEIEGAATRGRELVRQLLTFAQRDCVLPQVVELSSVVQDMEPLLRRTLGEQIHLQVSTADAPCLVLADPVQMEQVILNLVVNARDAMPEGGLLWIATALQNADPVDGASSRGGEIVLSVSDSGTGIDPEVRERMFEPFVTTKGPGRGTGLGLATVLGIVESSGGRIGVISEPGAGTTFEISLPRNVDETTSDEESKQASLFDASGLRILLVEDDATVGPSIARRLERCGFDVVSVSNASDALRIIERRTLDVVVTDAIMPGMSGVALVDRLRDKRPDLPVVLMSGYSQEIVDERAPTEGRQVLRKPFTAQQLLAAIETALTHASRGLMEPA